MDDCPSETISNVNEVWSFFKIERQIDVQAEPFPLLSLPKELICEVIARLNFIDRIEFSCTSQYMHSLEKDLGRRIISWSLQITVRLDNRYLSAQLFLFRECLRR